MRRYGSISSALGITTVIFLGCSQSAPPRDEAAANKAALPQLQVALQADPKIDGAKDPAPLPLAGDANQDKYEAALTEALTLLADRKYAEALVSLETARTFQDTDFIKGEIAKVKSRAEQADSAQKTVQNIETVLGEGKAGDAAKLAGQALKEFGDGEQADRLVKLRLQADALQNVDTNEGVAARYQRFRDEGDAALGEKNLRAAALAYEQALQAKEDADLKEKLAGIRSDLEKYDSLRKRAAELRRDPTQLDDALAALSEAAKSWDTLQVRQEIDETTLALQKRRDTVSVADFEVRGDLGIADAGRTFAEELLPLLKPRFDLVERAQVSKVLDELKLEAGILDDPGQQREVGRLAKVRYLVMGSVTRLAGLTVNARLVDVRTGLVMQTAKVIAPSVDQIVPLLPDLARQLLMSDEEKLFYEQEQVRLAKRPAPLPDDAPLPPPPPLPDADLPALPDPVIEIPAPPEFGGLRIEAFQALPAAPPPGERVPVPPPGAGDVRVKHRLLQAVLHLGDDLFRRGNYREANRHFEFALTLAPAEFDLRLRVERCRPLVPPPPPPVIIAVQPVVVIPPRPRIAVLNFLTIGDPRIVAPSLGPWTAANLTPYFRSNFEVVDQNEVYWYMGRLGMSLGDLMQDPGARRWLGRALNVRYFVLGTLQQTASFDAATYMVDAEYGFLQGSGRVHVVSSFELKLRLAELAGVTLMDPNERNRFLADAQQFARLVAKGRECGERREFSVAVTAFEDALRIRPGNVEVLAYLERARYSARQFAWEEEGRRRIQAEEDCRRRQWELAQAAEVVRIRAIREAAAYDVAERERREERRHRAQGQLLAQARVAIQTKNFSISLGFFEGAMALAPAPEGVVREFAVARADRDRVAREQGVEQAALREAAMREQRRRDLEQARGLLEEERLRNQAALELQAKIQGERDKAAFQRSFDEAQRLLARSDYDAAIGALQLARQPAQQLGKADLVEAMLTNALVDRAKGTQRAELESKLAAERDRRRQAEKDAKEKEVQYKAALEAAQRALADKNLEVAQAKYQEAGKLYATDTVLSGLRNVSSKRVETQAEANELRNKAVAAQERDARVKKLVAEGESAHAAQKFQAAVTALDQARKIAPDNVDVLTALTKAEQARNKSLAESRRQAEETGRSQTFQKLLKNGRDHLAAKEVDAAVANLTEALKLSPDDAVAKAALAQAQKAQSVSLNDAKAQEAARQKTEAYQTLLGDGKAALAAKRFDDAIQAFAKAQRLLPGDKTSSSFLDDATAQKKSDLARLAAETAKKAETLQRAADLDKALRQGRSALAVKDLITAEKSFNAAAQLAPQDATVVRALQDLQRAKLLAQADADAQNKRQEVYQAKLATAQKAFVARQYDDALKALGEANAMIPGGKAGQDLLKQVQKARTDARVADDTVLKQKLEQERVAKLKGLVGAGQAALKAKDWDGAAKAFTQARDLAPTDPGILQALRDLDQARKTDALANQRLTAYKDSLQAGQKALAAKRYEDALKAFTEAARLMPGDPTAKLFQQQAQKALLDAPKTPDVPKTNPVPLPKVTLTPFQNEMQLATALEKEKKYAEALKSYRLALKLAPGDAKAKEGAVRTEFTVHVLDGQKYLDTMKYAEAVREFEAALVLSPNNPAVTKLLAKAKQMKK